MKKSLQHPDSSTLPPKHTSPQTTTSTLNPHSTKKQAAEGKDEDLEAIGGKWGADGGDSTRDTCRADHPNEPLDEFAI